MMPQAVVALVLTLCMLDGVTPLGQVDTRKVDTRSLVVAARAHMQRAEWNPAYEQLRRALRQSPEDPEVLEALGTVASELAQAEFKRLFAMAPDSARVHQLMAESLETEDRRVEAETEYQAALAAKPDLLDALLGLAKLKRVRLDCDGAIELYAKAEAIHSTFDAAYGLGICYLRQQEDARALAHLEQAVARDPRAAIAWVGLGSALLRVDRTADAIEKLRHATVLEPTMFDAYYMLGRAYRAAGDTTRAKDAFDKAEQVRSGGSPPPR
jgi:tetratricopeptide (TPR) repeat protein